MSLKNRLIAMSFASALVMGAVSLPVAAGASTPRRGEFCAKAKLGHHYANLVCKKVGKYNRWE
jgi:hypothetical protein